MARAPTRNAFSLFTADNNLLFLSHSLSLHLQNHRHFRNRNREESAAAPAAFASLQERHRSLLASLDSEEPLSLEKSAVSLPPITEQSSEENLAPTEDNDSSDIQVIAQAAAPVSKDRSCSLWFEAIGAIASQKAQSQTPGFDPSVGGCILAWDKTIHANSLVGVGAAYVYTRFSEHQSAGSGKINQEYLFAYATWMNRQFYLDGVLWGGLFQTNQVRQIHVSGFNFRSTSTPHGWQLSPHIEFGYDKTWLKLTAQLTEFTLEPFTMLDWVNTWQSSYQEKGQSPFNAGQKSHYSSLLRSEVGVRFYETFSFQTWRCILEEKGSYVNKVPFGVGKVAAFLVGSPGSFTVETLSSMQNLGVAELALILEPVDESYPYGSLSYQGEFGSSFQSHQVTAEISWDF